jgi:hypothetical protein
MRTEDVPPNFSTLLLEKYRNYGESVQHRTAFQYFVGQILPAVNTSVTKYDKLKYSKTTTEHFTYTDEAFALMLVVNYEARWVSQYDAAVRLGTGGKIMKDQSRHWVDAKWDPKEVGLGKHSKVRAARIDIRHLVLVLVIRPTHMSELVEYEPEMAGTSARLSLLI